MLFSKKTTGRTKTPRRLQNRRWNFIPLPVSLIFSRRHNGSSFILPFFRDYCVNTTLHGFRYIAQDGRHWIERCIWTALCSLAVAGALITSWNIWNRFQTSPTMTVLESTDHPIEKLSFPAITICDSNHVRWDKGLKFQEKYLPDADEGTVDAFQRFLAAMALVNFGDFDKVENYFGNDTEDAQKLAGINVTQLMLEVMSTCEEFFVDKCWWRNGFFNCCSLFELQKSEYGFCYSFNSETSEHRDKSKESRRRKCKANDFNCTKELRPRRTSTSGMWSGLRLTVNVFPDQIPPLATSESVPGLIVFVTSPYSFPMMASDVAAGISAQISLTAQLTYTTQQVRTLDPDRRGCLYHDEGDALGLHEYRQRNCMAQCHRDSTLEYCNCTAHFFPTEGIFPVCDVRGLMCLSENNDVFNYEKPDATNPFFNDDQEGMMCSCSADCNRLEYASEIYVTPLLGRHGKMNDYVQLDVHFKQPAMVKYRTDVVFGWLDLTVSLGGIAGLFIGFSLLSGAELIYYLTFRLYGHWREGRRSKMPPHLNEKRNQKYATTSYLFQHSNEKPKNVRNFVPIMHNVSPHSHVLEKNRVYTNINKAIPQVHGWL